MWRLASVVLSCALAVAGTPEGKAAFEKEDYATARKELQPAAEGGDAEAQYLMGEIFRRGLGVGASPRMAQNWYELASAQGHGAASGELGILFWKAHKKKQAVEMLRAGAAAKHVRAMYALALLDYRGHDVGVEDAERIEFFRLAAEGGHPDAQAKHAANLRFGKTEGGIGEAERWYRKAAKQGHPHAHAGVGACRFKAYDQGDGSYNMTAREEAFEWYEKAALLGDYEAQHWLTLYYGALRRFAKSYAWGTIASTTRNARPTKSKVITKLHKKWAKNIKDYIKKNKALIGPEDVREGKRLAKEYLKQIRTNLEKDLPWEEPDG